MTKSKLSLIFTLLFLLNFSLSGCAANAANTTNATNTTSVNTATEVITIANRGPAFFVNDNFQPIIKLKRGKTYTFEVNSPNHPFWIKTAESWGKGDAFTSGVTGNGTTAGTVIFNVPKDAPDLLFYNCEVHPNMHGRIEISN